MGTADEMISWLKEFIGPIADTAKKYGKKIILGVAILLVVLAILKISLLFGLYFFFANLITEMTGLDHSYVRSISILFVVGTLMALPTLLGWFTFQASKKKVAIIAVVFTVLTIGIVKYKSSHIFFDRENGKPISYYIETPKGYKFSTVENFDPTYGTKYLPVTKEIIAKFLDQSGEKKSVEKEKPSGEEVQQGNEKLTYYEKQKIAIYSARNIADLLTYPTPDSPSEEYNSAFMRRLEKMCYWRTCEFTTNSEGNMMFSYYDNGRRSETFVLKDQKRKANLIGKAEKEKNQTNNQKQEGENK